MDETTRNQIIELFNLGSLPADKQEHMIVQLGELVFQGAMARVMADLTEDQEATFENKFSEDMSPEDLMALLNEFAPNFPDILREELIKIKEHADAVLPE